MSPQEHTPARNRGLYKATVLANKPVRTHFYRLRLRFTDEAATAFSAFKPGQFVQLDASNLALPAAEKIPTALAEKAGRNILLRRPFSFAEVTTEGDATVAELLYRVFGPATLRMTTLRPQDTVSILGPLGNGFSVPPDKSLALLVAGGMGLPPIQLLAQYLANDHPTIETIAFAGAKTKTSLPFESALDEISQNLGFAVPEFARYGVPSQIATDDGSVGFAGLVTDCVEKYLQTKSPEPAKTIIFGCGPEPMLAALATLAARHNIQCQISMERRMACGIGLCQSCAVECRQPGTDQTTYRLCCEDGPVFDAEQVVFEL